MLSRVKIENLISEYIFNFSSKVSNERFYFIFQASASTITQVNTNTVLHPRTGVRPKALRPKEISTKINSKPTTSENLTNTINQDPNQVPLVQVL